MIFRTITAILAAMLCVVGAYAQRGHNSGFNLIVLGDTQPQTEEQITRLSNEILPDIEEIIAEYDTDDDIPEILLITGDVVWDTMAFLPRIKQMFEALDVELFTLPGNHDYDRSIVGREHRALREYRATFGRRYYATTIGQSHLIALDNILYTSYDDYSIGIDRREMRWLRRTLRHIPHDSRIIVAMHAPALNFRTEELLPYAQEIIDLAEGRELHFITGHRHQNSTAYINRTTTEHSVAQVNGNLWFAPYCVDGTPRGVLCVEEKEEALRWHFRTLGEERDYQMKAYPAGSVDGNEEYIVVKVWAWDERWRVEWSEEGVAQGAMEQIEAHDPDYMHYVDNEADHPEHIMQRLRSSARPTKHLFRCRPSNPDSTITITATDSFGDSYFLTITP